MKTVISKEGIELSDVKSEKVGKENRLMTIVGAFLLAFIPLGSIVMLINAYLCYTKTFIMCFHENGMQDVELYRQLNQEEQQEEKVNAYIYLGSFTLFRLIPFSYYLVNHYFA